MMYPVTLFTLILLMEGTNGFPMQGSSNYGNTKINPSQSWDMEYSSEYYDPDIASNDFFSKEYKQYKDEIENAAYNMDGGEGIFMPSSTQKYPEYTPLKSENFREEIEGREYGTSNGISGNPFKFGSVPKGNGRSNKVGTGIKHMKGKIQIINLLPNSPAFDYFKEHEKFKKHLSFGGDGGFGGTASEERSLPEDQPRDFFTRQSGNYNNGMQGMSYGMGTVGQMKPQHASQPQAFLRGNHGTYRDQRQTQSYGRGNRFENWSFPKGPSNTYFRGGRGTYNNNRRNHLPYGMKSGYQAHTSPKETYIFYSESNTNRGYPGNVGQNPMYPNEVQDYSYGLNHRYKGKTLREGTYYDQSEEIIAAAAPDNLSPKITQIGGQGNYQNHVYSLSRGPNAGQLERTQSSSVYSSQEGDGPTYNNIGTYKEIADQLPVQQITVRRMEVQPHEVLTSESLSKPENQKGNVLVSHGVYKVPLSAYGLPEKIVNGAPMSTGLHAILQNPQLMGVFDMFDDGSKKNSEYQ